MYEYNNDKLYDHAYTGYPLQESAKAESAAPQEPEQRKKRKPAGIIASLLAVGVISGAAGGGAVYGMMSSGAQAEPAAAAASPTATDTTPLTTLNTQSADITAIVDKASDSVVEISIQQVNESFFTGRYVSEGAGSGVVLTEDGFIATNDHVVDGSSEIRVRTKDGTEYEATLIGTDEKTDLAVIKVEATGLKPVSFANSDEAKVGELAVAIGNPLGTLGGTVTNGIISAKDREITIDNQTMTLLQTSAAVNPGNSGGGLFNAYGELVGIVNMKSSGTNVEGLGFAIPSNTVKQVTDEIIANGYVTGRPQLGIGVVEVSDPMTASMYRLQETGVYVASVNTENGLVVGDRIVSIDGTAIETRSDISKLLGKRTVGDSVEIVVARDGQEQTISVTLTEQIPESIQKRIQDSVKLTA